MLPADFGDAMSDGLSFHMRLRQLREQRGISQSTLATRVGVSEETLRAWELGRRRPGKDTVVKLATALEFTPGTPEWYAFIALARGLALPAPAAPDNTALADTAAMPPMV